MHSPRSPLPFVTFMLITFVSVAFSDPVTILVKLETTNGNVYEAGKIEIAIGKDWILAIARNKETEIQEDNMHWSHWINVESFQFQLIPDTNSELTNLHNLVSPDGIWIRVKNFKITETQQDILYSTVRCAEDILVKVGLDAKSGLFGIGSIKFIDGSNWTLLIKFTQVITVENDKVSISSTTGQTWIDYNYYDVEFQFSSDVDYEMQVSSGVEVQKYWITSTSKRDERAITATGVAKIRVTIGSAEISLVQKNTFIDKTFEGYLTSNNSILTLVLPNQSVITSFQDIYKHKISPVLHLKTGKSASSTPGQNILIDFRTQHKVTDCDTVILVFNYWNATVQGTSVTYTLESGFSQTLTMSKCYIANSSSTPFALGRVVWDQSTFWGSIWINKVWSNNARTYVIPDSSSLLDEIKDKTSFNITMRIGTGGKAPIMSLDYKQWATIQKLSTWQNSFTGQITIGIGFGVKIHLQFQTEGQIHEMLAFLNSSDKLLTLISKNDILLFDGFLKSPSSNADNSAQVGPERLLKPPVSYQVLPEKSYDEALQAIPSTAIKVTKEYISVDESKSVFQSDIRQYSYEIVP